MSSGRVSAQQLVAAYFARMDAFDRSGPSLNSVLARNPRALADARLLDEERARGHVRGPLHGIPILIKDNIESADPLPTTAGSLALANNLTQRDAPVVARLRAAGAIVLGKTNLSEWANIRSTHATSGWSAVGGLTKNPYALDRNACGSSSGSGVAIAASFAAFALGTETDGSITCPASLNGLVGLKPSMGLVPRTHIIPITSAQDTAGPMARTVEDAALALSIIAGPDPADPATQDAGAHKIEYLEQLDKNALRGKRLGLLKFYAGFLPSVDALLEATLQQLRAAGAEVVLIEAPKGLEDSERAALDHDELMLMLTDLRIELNAYLASAPQAVKTRSLADVIAFNREHAREELPYFEQELFIQAEATANHDPSARAQQRANLQTRAARALDQLLAAHACDALIAPTVGPAWTTDLINGDHWLGSATTLPAIAGYPHLSVPMGQVHGLPVGLSFMGPAWSDAKLLALAFAFQQQAQHRTPPPL
jgi:amidase